MIRPDYSIEWSNGYTLWILSNRAFPLEMVPIAPRVLTFQVAAGTKLRGPKFHSTPTDRKMMSAATSQAKSERWHQK
jgi:hypothetical protein